MYLQILTPEKEFFTGEVKGVKMPGIDGSFEILKDHAPLIAALKEGSVRVHASDGTKHFHISSGFVECLNNKVTLLAEGASEA